MELIEKYDVVERIRCINPSYGYKKSREARTDSISGYPNGVALREYLRNIEMSNKESSLAIYTVDILGLHNFNELYGDSTGDRVIVLTLDTVNKAVSVFGGKTYRENTKGDEVIAVVEDIDRQTADSIPKRIRNVFDCYTNLKNGLSISVAIGMVHSPNRKDPFKNLDKSKDQSHIEKAKIYTDNPELERRKHRSLELVNKL